MIIIIYKFDLSGSLDIPSVKNKEARTAAVVVVVVIVVVVVVVQVDAMHTPLHCVVLDCVVWSSRCWVAFLMRTFPVVE